MKIQKINRLLVANRGEIAIRVLRAASEMKIRTLAIYTFEDRYSLHRYKADEAYQIGSADDPLKPYLDIEEIIKVAKENNVDAIHPGYGFLSENVQFVRRCKEEGIIFVGPQPEVMEQLGDKIAAKNLARSIAVPVIEDCMIESGKIEEAMDYAERIGFPLIFKAAAGGGGRGMRVIRKKEDLINGYREASNEALKAFGDGTVFIEKYIDQPKHIEVQILADNFGNTVHLFERDCSVQRRFQKVVEIAPAPNLSQSVKQQVYDYSVKIAKAVNYNNAGTVEFLVDKDDKVYFIEVNPRIQVEHTVTEEITGIDLVRSQILIASGETLSSPKIFIRDQSDIKINGYAIQCRITTEDPENNFKPDYGTIIAYRNAAGFGIRLDEGSAYSGMKISPFFDSMLVKVTATGRTLLGASNRLLRTLAEFRVRGVSTNIRFLENVIQHEIFKAGQCTVTFIDTHPELFQFKKPKDTGTKILKYLANIKVNGHPDIKVAQVIPNNIHVPLPSFIPSQGFDKGSKNFLDELGRDAFIQKIKNDPAVYYTDTTYRDAHQSLLATRVRTKDILTAAASLAQNNPQLFSAEVWGGATFDVALRFLHECPWERLKLLRTAMPNILLQMLFRGSNAVGYSAYPKNIIQSFIIESWNAGIDVFRIFDSLNNLESMLPAIQTVVNDTNAIAQASICYTGDVLRKGYNKYDIDYYVSLAKRLEDAGAHMLAIKDMAGLLKPAAAESLITALKNNVAIPISLHTHDTAGTQLTTYLSAIESGIDVVDCAIAGLSGTTSQPSLNSLITLMNGNKREREMNLSSLNQHANYWSGVRNYYLPFESDLKCPTVEVYENEIPGGQYSNLGQQANAVGLGNQIDQIKKNYQLVNKMFGDIVKVTPSSKVVGDMALFMTSNQLTEADIMDPNQTHSFPSSVIGFFKGELGIPYGGFPEELKNIILKNERNLSELPSNILPDVDLEKDFQHFLQLFPNRNFLDYLSWKMFPKVFEEYDLHESTFGNVSEIPTLAFFYPLKTEEELLIKLAPGKTIHVKLLFVSEADEEGYRTVNFELNGYYRTIKIKDEKIKSTKIVNTKVSDSHKQLGAPLQGKLTSILCKLDDQVKEGDPLFVIEAMKMESTVCAHKDGKISHLQLNVGTMVDQNDWVVSID